MPPTPRSAVILIVEDEDNDVLFLKRALKKANVPFPVRVARDGQQAIDYLSGTGVFQNREQYPIPCIIILDLKLPKKNGIEVLQWLRRREEFRDLPVVMVTSTAEKAEKEVAFHDGIEAFLVKPVSFEELVHLARTIGVQAAEHCKDAKPAPTENDSGV